MKIGICDDIIEYVNAIKTYVEYYFKLNNMKCEIFTYSCGEDLKNSNITFDILFIDVELPDINGIELAKSILSSEPETIVIVVTNYRKYLDAAMDLNVLRFVDKPITQNRINDVLIRAIDEIKNGTIVIKTKNNKISKIKKSDIIYVEVMRKTTTFYTTNGVIKSTEPISKFKELLNSPDFATPHNSFLVNLNYVLSYEREKVTIDYGTNPPVISIATRKQPLFRKQFIDFLGDKQ